MNADLFFGYTTGGDIYDLRRHVNILFMNILDYNLSLNDYQNVSVVNNILSIRETNEKIAARLTIDCLLNPQQLKFLRFMKDKYLLSEEEFITILSIVSGTTDKNRTPAGYSKLENIILVSHLVMATSFFVQREKNLIAYYSRITPMFPTMGISRKEFVDLVHITADAFKRFGDFYLNYDSIEAYIKNEMSYGANNV